MRNTHRIGDYLATDDESGIVHYASDMARDWDGQWRHKDNLDGRHPQLDVAKAVKRDPRALKDIRPQQTQSDGGANILLENGLNVFALLMESGDRLLLEETFVRR